MASNIAVTNAGEYEVSFSVQWEGGSSSETSSFPLGQTETIDLTTLGLAQGTEVWPVINIVLGTHNFACDPTVKYYQDERTATYTASGTSLNPSCALSFD